MPTSPDSLASHSLVFTGRHHPDTPALNEYSLTYETDTHCFVIAQGKVFNEADYTYPRIDDAVGTVTYSAQEILGHGEAHMYATFNFEDSTFVSVTVASGLPFNTANGTFTMTKPIHRP